MEYLYLLMISQHLLQAIASKCKDRMEEFYLETLVKKGLDHEIKRYARELIHRRKKEAAE